MSKNYQMYALVKRVRLNELVIYRMYSYHGTAYGAYICSGKYLTLTTP